MICVSQCGHGRARWSCIVAKVAAEAKIMQYG